MNKISEEPLLSLPERHNRILTLLQQNGSISVTQLSDLFRVSEVTIRKDLSYLEQQKKTVSYARQRHPDQPLYRRPPRQ